MKKICILMMLVVSVFGVSKAQAVWLEDFNSYAVGPLKSWESEYTGSSQQSVNTGGYTGNGIYTPGVVAAQYRAVGTNVYQMTARIRQTTGVYDISEVGFCPANADDAGADLYESSATIRINGNVIGLITWTAAGAVKHYAGSAAVDPDTTWYDVRLTIIGSEVLGEYRESAAGDTGDWTTVDRLALDAGFAANYVGLRSDNNTEAAMDDIETIAPEPWSDDFNSYAVGTLPNNDWVAEYTGASQQSVNTGGYTGNAIQTWGAAAQYRVAGADIYHLTARLRDTTDLYDLSEVGFCPANAGDAGVVDLYASSVTIRMTSGTIGFLTWTAAGAVKQYIGQGGLELYPTWYDVRMTVTGLSVLAEYRVSGTGAWSTLGTLVADAGFAPSYIGLKGDRHNEPAIDDVWSKNLPKGTLIIIQ